MLTKTRLSRLLLAAAGAAAVVVGATVLSTSGSLAQVPPTNTPSPTATRPPGTPTTPTSGTPTTPVAAQATPVPAAATPVPSTPSACTLPLARATGGQTIEFEQIQVTLPAGDYVYGFIESGASAPAIVLCNTQTDATIYISGVSGQSLARRATTPQGESVLNSLLAGVRARGSAPGGGTSGSGGLVILPPNTGGGGLLR